MSELDEIRQKKMQELMAQQAQQQQQEAEFAQQITQLENVVKTLFTKEALQRYGNLKAAHPENAVKLLAVIGQGLQKGKIKKIDDNDLKEILIKITPERRDIKITQK
jgi:programmed cell death protein 5